MLAQLFPAPSYYPDMEQKNYSFCFGNFFIIGVEGECPQISELGSHWLQRPWMVPEQCSWEQEKKEVSLLPVPVSC